MVSMKLTGVRMKLVWMDWQVEWGEASMLQAERLLLKEALQDPLNQRFILLSDRCALFEL